MENFIFCALKRVSESIYFQRNKFITYKVKNEKEVAKYLMMLILLNIIQPFQGLYNSKIKKEYKRKKEALKGLEKLKLQSIKIFNTFLIYLNASTFLYLNYFR